MRKHEDKQSHRDIEMETYDQAAFLKLLWVILILDWLRLKTSTEVVAIVM